MHDSRGTLQSPAVLPGEIWLIEHNPEAALPPKHREAVNNANVVLFDRALARQVIEGLPLGSYAEPLPALGHAVGPAISPRALELAGDGWSVVQLVEASPARRARLHSILSRADGNRDLPVRVVANDGADRLTVVFGPLVARGPAPANVFTANGLAG